MSSLRQITSLLRERELAAQKLHIEAIVEEAKAEFASKNEDQSEREPLPGLIDQLFTELGSFYADYLKYDGDDVPQPQEAYLDAGLLSVVSLPTYEVTELPCWPAGGVVIESYEDEDESEMVFALYLDVSNGTVYSNLHPFQSHSVILTKELLFSFTYREIAELLNKVRLDHAYFILDHTGSADMVTEVKNSPL